MEKIVMIESRGGHDGAATGGHYGSWAKIWASREGIARVEVVTEQHDYYPGRLSYHNDYIEVKVIWDENALQENDYIIVEHKRTPNPFLGGSSSREYFELLAGKMPTWANFPQAWSNWVSKTVDEAIDFLLSLADYMKDKELYDLIEFACRKTAKNRIYRAWEEVQDYLNKAGLLRYEPSHTGTWTGVTAMPIKIAWAVDGKKSPIGRFKPSHPKPKFQKREDAHPVLIASPSMFE